MLLVVVPASRPLISGVAVVSEAWKIRAMTATDLARSATTDDTPPLGISNPARALWLAKAGRWNAAHDLCQKIPGSTGAWIHAYLHREEGDHSNASYWYSRAGKSTPTEDLSLDDEWLAIAGDLL